MKKTYQALLEGAKNFVFLGEAGSGKSEIALNCAIALAKDSEQGVHFFDLDQTKPLYRSRDARSVLATHNITLHHEVHDFDSPTIVGGVTQSLNSADFTLLDIGGGENGAKMIGRFAKFLNRDDTAVYYVVNPYRPWSRDIWAVDQTLSAILQVSRINKVRMLVNPNLGAGTSAEEFLEGLNRAKAMLDEHITLEAAFVREELLEDVSNKTQLMTLPLNLYLKYDWIDE
ncbi:hypothetical protein LJC42_03965 [Eubacteriales bacterium OttesenSCG-928-K08]|nr:hypothetical protein [Eubacteriales bacterium OttesenSCG-928-K08]